MIHKRCPHCRESIEFEHLPGSQSTVCCPECGQSFSFLLTQSVRRAPTPEPAPRKPKSEKRSPSETEGPPGAGVDPQRAGDLNHGVATTKEQLRTIKKERGARRAVQSEGASVAPSPNEADGTLIAPPAPDVLGTGSEPLRSALSLGGERVREVTSPIPAPASRQIDGLSLMIGGGMAALLFLLAAVVALGIALAATMGARGPSTPPNGGAPSGITQPAPHKDPAIDPTGPAPSGGATPPSTHPTNSPLGSDFDLGLLCRVNKTTKNLEPMGTAFAVAPNKMATQARHLALGQSRLVDPEYIVVAQGKPLKVTSIRYHPRYPVGELAKDQPDPGAVNALFYYDVALLTIEGLSARPAALASETQLVDGAANKRPVTIVGFGALEMPAVLRRERGHLVESADFPANKGASAMDASVVGAMNGAPVLNDSGRVVGLTVFQMDAQFNAIRPMYVLSQERIAELMALRAEGDKAP